MKVKLYLDSRSTNEEVPVRLRVTVNKTSALISTGVKVKTSQWNAVTEKVVRHERHATYNTFLYNFKAKVENNFFNYSLHHDLTRLSRDELRKVAELTDGSENEEIDKSLFASHYRAFMKTKAERTQEIYQATMNRMVEYDKQLERRTFEEIDKKWLQSFDAYLKERSPSPNARAIHFRNIRAVFNDALDDEVTSAYPFRKFKIRYEATRKRSLTVEQLRAFFNAPTKDVEEKYLDFFKLTFFLIGINIIDLCHLKEVTNGRIEYRRAKTHRLYSIKVEPEVQPIIDKYRGKKWLLAPLDTFGDYRRFALHLNKQLQRIGGTEYVGRGNRKVFKPMFPDITTYWARHTWATIAASLDIPKATIAHALGHSSAFSSVTDIYIDFDMRKVDEANRKVIDWVLYGRK